MGFKNLFFGNDPLGGMDEENSALARSMMLIQLGNAISSMYNPQMPGGIDPSGISRGMQGALESLLGIRQNYQQTERLNRQDARAENADTRAENQYQLGLKEYERQGIAEGRRLEAEGLEKGRRRAEASHIAGRVVKTDEEATSILEEEKRRRANPPRVLPGPYDMPGGGQAIGTFDPETGKMDMVPIPEGATRHEREYKPPADYYGFKYDDQGNPIGVIGNKQTGELDTFPAPGARVRTPDEIHRQKRFAALKQDLKQMVKSYYDKVHQINMNSVGSMRDKQLQALYENYIKLFPENFNLDDPSTWDETIWAMVDAEEGFGGI